MTRGTGGLAAALLAGSAAALAFAAASCDEGSAAAPTFAGGETADAAPAPAGDGGDAGAYAVCPPGIDASFGSIYTQMLSTPSCGSNNPSGCHSTSGSLNTGSLLDYSLDAGAVYGELLGDGSGVYAQNIDHPDVLVPRVVPGDASASMLYIKLTLVDASNDPMYGAGMPLTAPGSVCPAVLSAVAGWINAGAPPPN